MHGRRSGDSTDLATDQPGNSSRSSLMWEDVFAAMDFEDDYFSTEPSEAFWWEFKGYENYTRYEKVGERYVGEDRTDENGVIPGPSTKISLLTFGIGTTLACYCPVYDLH